MQCLNVMGFADYYYLDNDKIYNSKRKQYMKEISEFRYRLRTKDMKDRSVTLKEIYKFLFDEVFCIDNVERLENEEFKEIEGTEGNYLVSNFGRILSKKGNYSIILKPTVTSKGYERLQIIIDGKTYNKFVHCIVAAEWLERPQNLEQEIHHIDFNKRNNNCNNLQYLSKIEHTKKHTEGRKSNNARIQ